MESSTIDQRLAAIEQRLAILENSLNLSLQKSPRPKLRPQPAVVQPPRQLNWLDYIAVLYFMLAAGLVIKLSMDSGWLVPARQVGLAALFGLGLIGAGMVLGKSDREYARLLPAAGLVVLYCTVFAAHRYYALMPFDTAVAATCFVSALGIYLYTELRHDLFPLVATLGAYGVPVLTGVKGDGQFAICYFMLCSIMFAVISVWLKSRLLVMVSAYLSILTTVAIGGGIGQDKLIASALMLNFLIFFIGNYIYNLQNGKTLTESEASSFLLVIFVFYAMEYCFLSRINHSVAPWVSLTFAGALFSGYLLVKQRLSIGLNSQLLVIAFTTLACFHAIYIEILPDTARPWLFALFMIAAAFLPAHMLTVQERTVYYWPSVAAVTIMVIEYMDMLSHVLDGNNGYWLMMSCVSLASIWFAIACAKDRFSGRTSAGRTLLGVAHMLAVVAIYQLTRGYGSPVIIGAWFLYAVGVVMFAFKRRDDAIAKSALYVLAFAAGKALLYT